MNELAPQAVPASQNQAIAPSVCADCAAPVAGKYCANCGQETLIETPTVRHFAEEFVDQFVALEGKLGRTLRVLLTRPGQLTLDYVEGRRQRYVRPLKLYLSISFLFFALLGLLPAENNPFLLKGADVDGQPPKVLIADEDDKAAAAAKKKDEPAAGSFEAKIEEKAMSFSRLSSAEQSRVLRQKLADDAPYAMFFLLPYFALLLRWFYRKQRLRYGVHLLFSLHLHCLLFIVLSLGFLPLPLLLRRGFELAITAYVFIALRRVYGGTPARTLWRMFWLWTFYILAVGVSAASGVLSVLLGVDAA